MVGPTREGRMQLVRAGTLCQKRELLIALVRIENLNVNCFFLTRVWLDQFLTFIFSTVSSDVVTMLS